MTAKDWTKKRPKINKPCILLVHNTLRNITNAYNFIGKKGEYVAIDEAGYWVDINNFNNDNCLYLILDTPKEKEE